MRRQGKYPQSRLVKIIKLTKKIREGKFKKGISAKRWKLLQFIKKHQN